MLDGVAVVSRADVTLGTLAGALVDPVSQNICYLVVDHRSRLRSHRFVLPMDLTRFDRARGALLVDADITDLREVPFDGFAPFSVADLPTSDADLRTGSFSPRAA
jgi:hypothetical protein